MNNEINLQTLVTELKHHYDAYGFDGGLGNSLEVLINDLCDLGHSPELITKIWLHVYYNHITA